MNHIAVQAWFCLQYSFFEGTFLGSERYPAQMQTIAGTTKVIRLRQLAKAADVVLSRQEWYEIYRAAGNVLP